MPPIDPATLTQWGTIAVSLISTLAVVRHQLAALSAEVADLKRQREEDVSKSASTDTALGLRLDALRERVAVAEINLQHQDAATARIEAAINSSSARLESQISQLHLRLDEILANRRPQ